MRERPERRKKIRRRGERKVVLFVGLLVPTALQSQINHLRCLPPMKRNNRKRRRYFIFSIN